MDLRKRLGLTRGGAIFIEETDDGVVLRTAAQNVARAQALARQYVGDHPESGLAAFLAKRHQDSGE